MYRLSIEPVGADGKPQRSPAAPGPISDGKSMPHGRKRVSNDHLISVKHRTSVTIGRWAGGPVLAGRWVLAGAGGMLGRQAAAVPAAGAGSSAAAGKCRWQRLP